MKKIPYGISNYEKIVEDNYYYLDKTMYIEELENLNETSIMFLRPRKFGKTLFTSTLENYYDIKKKDKFEKLYGETYIGKNPTKLRNSYHILRFNFAGIDTSTEETTIEEFKNRVQTSIEGFVDYYGLNFYVDPEQPAETMLNNIFLAFRLQKPDERIYVIIDEYDHFANELLGFNTDKFKELVSKNRKVIRWYEILKNGTETVVYRIFMTGVAPITLDGLTSGFNIISDMTLDERFNEMLGFTEDELSKIMEDQEIAQNDINRFLPIMKENYGGYMFSTYGKERMYNSNMCLYFLNEYITSNKMPSNLIDENISSDYSNLGKMLDICERENQLNILEKAISGEEIIVDITLRFNPEIRFGEKEFVSMLFYLGYLTIQGELIIYPKLGIPNKVMKKFIRIQ